MIYNLNNVDIIDKLQNATIKNETEKKQKNAYEFDKLKMYFGEDFSYKGIDISMPTIGNILELGEERFFRAMSPFVYNSTSIRVMLWENGIDWCKLKDIEVYAIMSKTVTDKEGQSLVFKNLSLNDFVLLSAEDENGDGKAVPVLYNKDNGILLYEKDYMVIAEYIREILGIHPKVEKVKGKTTKSWIIQEDKMNIQEQKNNSGFTLLPLISSCTNHPGFKYKLQELKDIGIYQFMDSVRRIQKYENSTAALKGCYSGFVDSSKLDKKVLNYMGDV